MIKVTNTRDICDTGEMSQTSKPSKKVEIKSLDIDPFYRSKKGKKIISQVIEDGLFSATLFRIALGISKGQLNPKFKNDELINWAVTQSDTVLLDNELDFDAERTKLPLLKDSRNWAIENGILKIEDNEELLLETWDRQIKIRKALRWRKYQTIANQAISNSVSQFDANQWASQQNCEPDLLDAYRGKFIVNFWDEMFCESNRDLEDLVSIVSGIPIGMKHLVSEPLDEVILFSSGFRLEPVILKGEYMRAARACAMGDLPCGKIGDTWLVNPLEYLKWFQNEFIENYNINNVKSQKNKDPFSKEPTIYPLHSWIVSALFNNGYWDPKTKTVLTEPVPEEDSLKHKRKRGRPSDPDRAKNDQEILVLWNANKGEYDTYQSLLDNPPYYDQKNAIDFEKLGIKNSKDFEKAIRRANKANKNKS